MANLPAARLLRYGSGDPLVMTAATRETILLVEDEPAVRQLFAQALTRDGYAVY